MLLLNHIVFVASALNHLLIAFSKSCLHFSSLPERCRFLTDCDSCPPEQDSLLLVGAMTGLSTARDKSHSALECDRFSLAT